MYMYTVSCMYLNTQSPLLRCRTLCYSDGDHTVDSWNRSVQCQSLTLLAVPRHESKQSSTVGRVQYRLEYCDVSLDDFSAWTRPGTD